MNNNYEHHFVTANGVSLHVVQAGPTDGPVALLLHGFPEFWRAWSAQIDALVSAGYRVWVPDQRGYNESEKPVDVRSYHIDTLADDVCGLIKSAGRGKVTLFGHDWGGAVSWWVANRNPDLIDRLIVVNAAHFAVMLQHMTTNVRQLLRSWYIFFFQIPRLPEYFLRRRNYRALVNALTTHSRPGTFSAAEVDLYRSTWRQPGSLTSMLNWYRALMRGRLTLGDTIRITVPTLLLWGAQDHALGREMAQPSIDLCDQGELKFIEDAGHWVLHEASESVNRFVHDFLTKA